MSGPKKTVVITELLGDGIGPELKMAIHRIADALPLEFVFDEVDLSLENREKMGTAVYDQALASMNKTQLAIKYPTVTAKESPNARLRNLFDFHVIHRPVMSIPGISSNFRENIDIDIIRIATGGTYEHGGEMVNRNVAVSLRVVDREPCQQAAEYAFRLARRTKKSVTSSSKYTIQRITDGFFEEVVKKTHERFPDVVHKKELFDALLAKMILKPHQYQVVIVLNEYGDFLSDMACGLVGSLGTGASGNFSFDRDNNILRAMFDPAGGTAPDITGKNQANPAAIMLAFVMLLSHIGQDPLADQLRGAIFKMIVDGKTTPDLGGSLTTTGFTDGVIAQLQSR